MNLNFRKSLRGSSKCSSTFYLDSFEMPESNSIFSLELCQFSPVIDFRKNENIIPIKPIPSVIKFDLNSNRSKGIVGQIVFTNFRIKFIPYSQIQDNLDKISIVSDSKQENEDTLFKYPPFELFLNNSTEIEISKEEDIEYLHISNLICLQNILQIYHSDFRCIEFQFKSSNLVKNLVEQLENLTIKPYFTSNLTNISNSFSSNENLLKNIAASRNFELSYFWLCITLQYSFNYPKDWEQLEGYWYFKNKSLRISQANENYQLCKSLPTSFISLKYYLTDVNIQKISAQIKGQRVPIIVYSRKFKYKLFQSSTYIFNERDHLLIRSGWMNKDAATLLSKTINPIQIIDVNNYLPDIQKLYLIYLKLRAACFVYSNETHFFNYIGKWMKLVSKILKIVYNLSQILNEKSSILLMEDEDNYWNIILSCLIQICLDKRRRTIEGFNSLLSKEWIFAVGLHNNKKLDYSKLPDQILFVLFLDCVYQILNQNSNKFEFTSLYLIRCFDTSCKPYSTFIRNQNGYLIESLNDLNEKKKNSNQSPILMNLTFEQLMFYYNPFYDKSQADTSLNFKCKIFSLSVWRQFYLRWYESINLNYYNQFNIPEYLYFQELLTSNCKIFNHKLDVSSNQANN